MVRGQWIDPHGADVPLEQWAETFLTFARSLAPTTQQTYRRDLWTYVLPRFGSVRLGRLSPEEIETWLNEELAKGLAPSSVHRHYRTLRRVLQTAVEKDRCFTNPCDRVRPPKVPRTEMTVLTWEQATALAEAHAERYRTLIYVAIDTGMRWSELVGLRRGKVDVARRKIRVVEQLISSTTVRGYGGHRRRLGNPHGHDFRVQVRRVLADHLDRFVAPEPDALVFGNAAGQPLSHSSFQTHHFKNAAARRRRAVPVPRPAPHERRPGHRRRRPPEGDPGPHGPQLDHRHPRPLRASLPGAGRSHRHCLRRPVPGDGNQ